MAQRIGSGRADDLAADHIETLSKVEMRAIQPILVPILLPGSFCDPTKAFNVVVGSLRSGEVRVTMRDHGDG